MEMKNPVKWFEEAVSSGKYREDVISKMKSCISEDEFDIEKFMKWLSKELEEEQTED